MRILRVAQKVYPDVKGGGAYHVHAMSRDQAAMGHDVTVLTVRQDKSLPHVEERDGYTVVRHDPVMNLLGNEISPGLAQYLATTEDFDIIHAHSHLYFSTNLAAVKRFVGDIPLAITNHGLYSQNAPEWVFRWYLKTLGRWTFNQADVVFCYTDEDRERVRELGVSSRIEVVHNGVDTERFTPDGPKSELIDHDGPIVLFVGRLVEGKRPQDAIRAVSQLAEVSDVKLYVVGEGPMRSELERLAGENVVFLGQVPYEEMPRIYRSGDVLLLPSRAEGLPRTVLEAFASSIPVVSSYLDHTAPIVQKGGYTVKVGNVEKYRSVLEDILDSKGLGQSGRDLVVNRFRWQNTAVRTTDVLTNL
ncbi:glycosyltransferase family 4 protein [Natrinema limicola]|uniref:Glycosyltransferase, type 1 n=1 Tax=Natrinema limicola JCM 13563 TaxID=1230457 RepID=M0CGH8_9EURY|nr:glycosyltransferase family 4 protein [Natrinema limicola]ELZ21462.1 glycosyltransferase, type 1 [Natrinema limicola JCM 13563]